MRVLSVLMLSGSVVMMSIGCEGAPGEQGASAQPAAPAPTAEQVAAEQAMLKAEPWVGDASASYAASHGGGASQSGSWGLPVVGQRALTTANYTLRAGGLTGEMGFVKVEQAEGALLLRLYRGATFRPEDVELELPVSGALGKLGVEAAHGKLAVLGWDEAQPRLTVYRQSDKARLWSASLDVKAWEAPMVVAWQPSGHIAVEWRGGEGRYERAFYDGATGAERLRERLDPRVEAVLANPVAWIMEAPHDEASDPGDMTGLTTAQQWLRDPPRALGLACPIQPMESVRRRLIALDGGVLLIAAMPYMDRGGRPRSPNIEPAELGRPTRSDKPAAPVVMSARCSSVMLYDAERLRPLGSWAKIRE